MARTVLMAGIYHLNGLKMVATGDNTPWIDVFW